MCAIHFAVWLSISISPAFEICMLLPGIRPVVGGTSMHQRQDISSTMSAQRNKLTRSSGSGSGHIAGCFGSYSGGRSNSTSAGGQADYSDSRFGTGEPRAHQKNRLLKFNFTTTNKMKKTILLLFTMATTAGCALAFVPDTHPYMGYPTNPSFYPPNRDFFPPTSPSFLPPNRDFVPTEPR
jgi:hypothetical protein